MTILWITIGVALLVVWVLTVADVIRRRLGAKQTAAWLLIVLIVPFVGAIVYWIVRPAPPGEAEYFAAVERQRRYEAQHRP